MPNDDGEKDRIDSQYTWTKKARITETNVHSSSLPTPLRLVLNDKLFLAPLENPTTILDVGTGTGIWAMDCADDYPDAHVVGIDLSPIQPNYVPPNLQFEIFDLEEPWEMPERFDLVHTWLDEWLLGQKLA